MGSCDGRIGSASVCSMSGPPSCESLTVIEESPAETPISGTEKVCRLPEASVSFSGTPSLPTERPPVASTDTA